MGLLINRAKANISTSTGTGAATPGSAVVPFQTWATAGATAGYWYDYLIEWGNDWEVGCGYYNGTTITRPGPSADPQFASSTGSLLNISSGSPTIACVGNKNTLMHPGPFMPPLAADFTAASSDATMPTLANNAKVGFTLVTTTISNAADRYRYAYKALPGSGSWEVLCRIRKTTLPTEFWGGGLAAIESGTSKICSIITFQHNSGDPGYIDVRRGTLTGSPVDVAAFPQFSALDDLWYRIVHDSGANTYAYHFSVDGELWVQVASVAAATPFTTRADRIALVTFNANTTSGDIKLSCPYWWQSY